MFIIYKLEVLLWNKINNKIHQYTHYYILDCLYQNAKHQLQENSFTILLLFHLVHLQIKIKATVNC